MTDSKRAQVIEMALSLPDSLTRTAACRHIGRELHLGYFKVLAVVRGANLSRAWRDAGHRRTAAAVAAIDYRESDIARRKRLDLERAAMFRCPRCKLIQPCLTNHDEKPDPWRRRSAWTDAI